MMTREQFVVEIENLEKEGKVFNVESTDSGTVYLSVYGCKITFSLEEGVEGEISITKPQTTMEIHIDFNIVGAITKNENTYWLEFENGMSDVIISVK